MQIVPYTAACDVCPNPEAEWQTRRFEKEITITEVYANGTGISRHDERIMVTRSVMVACGQCAVYATMNDPPAYKSLQPAVA